MFMEHTDGRSPIRDGRQDDGHSGVGRQGGVDGGPTAIIDQRFEGEPHESQQEVGQDAD